MEHAKPRAGSPWTPARSASAALMLCLAFAPALAQVPTIEELEKRIDAAKKAQQETAAAARQPAPSVSGQVTLQPGQKTEAHPAPSGRLAEPQQQRTRQAAQATESARKEGGRAQARQAGRLETVAGNLLRDRQGSVWTAADNGRDVDWVEADRYCAQRGMHLPGVVQLESLVDRSGTQSAPCQAKQCKVSGLFHLTGYRFWAKQREGNRWGLLVRLDDGRRSFDFTGSRDNLRALCVRSAAEQRVAAR